MGKTKEELYSQVLNDFSLLSGEKISLPIVPLIVDFVKSKNQTSLFTDIKNKWIEENGTIAQAINRDLERGER